MAIRMLTGPTQLMAMQFHVAHTTVDARFRKKNEKRICDVDELEEELTNADMIQAPHFQDEFTGS